MRILLATYWLLPHVGGVWTYIDGLRRGLESLGHQVDILARDPRDPHDEHYYILNTGRQLAKSKIKDAVGEKVRRHYRKHLPHVGNWTVEQEIERNSFELAALYFGLDGYDLIHTQDVISTRALWRVKPRNIPLIATIHGCLAAEYLVFLGVTTPPFDTVWDYTVAREFYGCTSSDLTIVPTHWLKNILSQDHRVPPDHLQVIPYGLDMEQFLERMEQPTEISRPLDRWVLACPARLDIVKGHKYLLEALAMLKEVHSDWVCWLIGDGRERIEIEKQCRDLDLTEHVLFLGDRPDVPALLKQSDIFVLPSVNDNQPYAVMEAQAAGKPVVASQAGGIPEMVEHWETGMLSPPGQSRPLFENLRQVMENHVLRLYMTEKSQQFASQHWPLQKMTERTVSAYQSVLCRQGKGERIDG